MVNDLTKHIYVFFYQKTLYLCIKKKKKKGDYGMSQIPMSNGTLFMQRRTVIICQKELSLCLLQPRKTNVFYNWLDLIYVRKHLIFNFL